MNKNYILLFIILTFLSPNSVCYSSDLIPINPEEFSFSISAGSKLASTETILKFRKDKGTLKYSINYNGSEPNKVIVRKLNKKDLIRFINVLNYTKFMEINYVKPHCIGSVINYNLSYLSDGKCTNHGISNANPIPNYNSPVSARLDYIYKYLRKLIFYREENNSIKYWK